MLRDIYFTLTKKCLYFVKHNVPAFHAFWGYCIFYYWYIISFSNHIGVCIQNGSCCLWLAKSQLVTSTETPLYHILACAVLYSKHVSWISGSRNAKKHVIFSSIYLMTGSQDSSLGIATRYGPDSPGIESRRERRPAPRSTQPSAQWVPDCSWR